MKKHVKRLIKEHSKLQDKYNKLVNYIIAVHNGDIEHPSDKDFALMRVQVSSMGTYLITLEKRLNHNGITVGIEEYY